MKISVSNLNSRRQKVLQKHFLCKIFQSCALILESERIFQSETKSGKIGQSARYRISVNLLNGSLLRNLKYFDTNMELDFLAFRKIYSALYLMHFDVILF